MPRKKQPPAPPRRGRPSKPPRATTTVDFPPPYHELPHAEIVRRAAAWADWNGPLVPGVVVHETKIAAALARREGRYRPAEWRLPVDSREELVEFVVQLPGGAVERPYRRNIKAPAALIDTMADIADRLNVTRARVWRLAVAGRNLIEVDAGGDDVAS